MGVGEDGGWIVAGLRCCGEFLAQSVPQHAHAPSRLRVVVISQNRDTLQVRECRGGGVWRRCRGVVWVYGVRSEEIHSHSPGSGCVCMECGCVYCLCVWLGDRIGVYV